MAKEIRSTYNMLSLELTANFLEPFLGPGVKDAYFRKTGQKLKMGEILTIADRDISIASRWLESLSRVNDLPS